MVQYAFLGMETVLRLLEHDRLRAINDLRRHFLAAMGRQAVHEDRVGLAQAMTWLSTW